MNSKETVVNLAFTLPISQAERVIALVRSFDSAELNDQPATMALASENSAPQGGVPLLCTPIFKHQADHEQRQLKYLLAGRPDLQTTVRFIVQNAGRFYNDELGAVLGHQDSRDTFSRLGHITRKLRKAGIRADGFRGNNWYSTLPSSGRTLILVREDVLPVLAEALEN
jgi:hypothetical protein